MHKALGWLYGNPCTNVLLLLLVLLLALHEAIAWVRPPVGRYVYTADGSLNVFDSATGDLILGEYVVHIVRDNEAAVRLQKKRDQWEDQHPNEVKRVREECNQQIGRPGILDTDPKWGDCYDQKIDEARKN